MKTSGFRGIWLLLAGFGVLSAAVLVLCAVSAARLPDNLGRPLSGAELAEVAGRNSPLNADFPRGERIQKITIHHMAGDLALEELGESFSNRDRRASANYAIDSSGRVALYVEEGNRSWASSSRENDAQAVTIEVANDALGGEWHVSDAAYDALVELCADICRRSGIEALQYTGDAGGSLTTHRRFAETVCPGPYLEGRMEEIAAAVNARLRAP